MDITELKRELPSLDFIIRPVHLGDAIAKYLQCASQIVEKQQFGEMQPNIISYYLQLNNKYLV